MIDRKLFDQYKLYMINFLSDISNCKNGYTKTILFYLSEKNKLTPLPFFQTIVNMPTTYKASWILPK